MCKFPVTSTKYVEYSKFDPSLDSLLIVIEGVDFPGTTTLSFNTFITTVLIFVAVMMLCYGMASVFFGTRLLQRKNSARIGTMITASLNLFWLPFGTLYGIAALYLLTRPDVEQMFT